MAGDIPKVRDRRTERRKRKRNVHRCRGKGQEPMRIGGGRTSSKENVGVFGVGRKVARDGKIWGGGE